MQNKLMIFDKRFEVDAICMRNFLFIFAFAILAKGPVIFRGYAIDDYFIASGVDSTSLAFVKSQGRYISAGIMWIFSSLGTNVNDMYFSLGLITLFLYSVFLVSIFRFVGMSNSPAAGLVGAIMVAHPYLTEIFTFRMVLPYYCVALLFSIVALEALMRDPAAWSSRLSASVATLAMLLTYQVFLNYLTVTVIFAFVCGLVLNGKGDSSEKSSIYNLRAINLAVIILISSVVLIVIIRSANSLGLAGVDNRTSFIALGELPERLTELSSTLMKIYWIAEPIFSGWLKVLVALTLVLSLGIIFRKLFVEKVKKNIFFVFVAIVLLIPASIGVIIVSKDWWPVPRVLAHASIIVGLVFLLADECIQSSTSRFVKFPIFVSRIVILFGFVLLSNQILADQDKVNRWDRMMANRIILRLEMNPNFDDVKFIHISGGPWVYPKKLRTVQGDMNISALSMPYAKSGLLSEVSGYDFKWARTAREAIGDAYCAANQTWPHPDSVTVKDDLAIVCLRK
ncbi:MAG TPA: glucosyltransferase domain-containing protein [Rhodoferax sp.]|nr:glucosyltransferase domain-containing protein [Rhodoferax sp.]